MTRIISQTLFFLTLAFSSTLFGQGRINNDPILHNIWWTTYNTDNNTKLTCIINSFNNQNGLTKAVAYYSKSDSVYKIVELVTIPAGTQMTSSYLVSNKPIFISVIKNNYHLTVDKEQFSAFVGVVTNKDSITIMC